MLVSDESHKEYIQLLIYNPGSKEFKAQFMKYSCTGKSTQGRKHHAFSPAL